MTNVTEGIIYCSHNVYVEAGCGMASLGEQLIRSKFRDRRDYVIQLKLACQLAFSFITYVIFHIFIVFTGRIKIQ